MTDSFYTPPDLLFYDYELESYPSNSEYLNSTRHGRSKSSRLRKNGKRLIDASRYESSDLELPTGNDELSRSFLKEQRDFERIRSRYPFGSDGAKEFCAQSVIHPAVDKVRLVKQPIVVDNNKRYKTSRRLKTAKPLALALSYATVSTTVSHDKFSDICVLKFGIHSPEPGENLDALIPVTFIDGFMTAVPLSDLAVEAKCSVITSDLVKADISQPLSFVAESNDVELPLVVPADETYQIDHFARWATDRDLVGYQVSSVNCSEERPLPPVLPVLAMGRRFNVFTPTGYDLYEWWNRFWQFMPLV